MKILRFYSVAVLALSLGLGQQLIADELDTAHRKYEQAMVDISAKYDKQLKSLPVDYLKALGKYESALKKKGDLDGVLAYRSETKRFKEDKTVGEQDYVDGPTSLRSMQMKYATKHVGLRLEKQKRLLACAQGYNASLGELQKTLTKKGDIDGAMKVRERRKDADYSALEFELAEVQAEADALGVGSGKSPPADDRNPEPAVPADVAWEEVGGSDSKVYDKGTKMSTLPAADFKDISRKLKLTARSRGMKYPVSLVTLHDVVNVGWRTGSTLYRFEVGSRASKPLTKPMLVVDHFIKKLGRDSTINLYRTDTVKLRNFSAKDKVIVDTKGLVVRATSWWGDDMERPDGWRPPYASGSYVGAVITIFDAGENVVYQVVTDSALASDARDEIPEYDAGGGSEDDDHDDDHDDDRAMRRIDRRDERDEQRDGRRRRR